jgi:hypothetical protein
MALALPGPNGPGFIGGDFDGPVRRLVATAPLAGVFVVEFGGRLEDEVALGLAGGILPV